MSPAYAANGQLLRPLDYREWVYVSSGVGMNYGSAAPNPASPIFDNVFVTRDAYRAFMQTGRWPEQTMFILELRRSQTNVSINNGGFTQGPVVAIEAAVKDSARFPGGWAYFDFARGGTAESAAPLPQSASCYACHRDNTAVDNTFVQFYPTLFEVAERLGTINPRFDPKKKP